MRKVVIVTTTLALVVGVTWAVMASTGSGRTPVSCMDTTWQTSAVSTSSTQWAPVPGFSDHPISIFPIAVNVSAEVSGAPVLFRVLSTNIGSQTASSKPGPTRFVPGDNGPNSFAYQWVDRGNAGAEHSIFIRLQWRSPTGDPVHLRRGDMSLLYATDGCPGSS